MIRVGDCRQKDEDTTIIVLDKCDDRTFWVEELECGHKRKMRASYLENMPVICKGPIATGRKDYGSDGDSCCKWWLYTRTEHPPLPSSHYGGPGRWYTNRPAVRHSKSYTLVTQHCGLDI